MKITVRKVDTRNPEVLATLKYLQKECLPSDIPHAVNRGHWWIAYVDDIIPVGFAGMVRSVNFSDAGYLCRAGVLGKYQGKGIQKRMIKSRETYAKKLGWKWLITDTRQNPASANSLISCGFRMYTPSNPWADIKTVYWRKSLNAVQRPGSKKKKACGILKGLL
jgi:GNAT superfamily N-acetyltransferase